jgi:hypothetical protein
VVSIGKASDKEKEHATDILKRAMIEKLQPLHVLDPSSIEFPDTMIGVAETFHQAVVVFQHLSHHGHHFRCFD